MYSDNPKAKRLEFRCPDPTCNPYLTFPAIMMAALDGIENQIDPGKPMDRDIYEMSKEELKEVPKAPGSLEESLAALKKDNAFLLKGDVFTPDLIESWITWKEEKELDEMHLRPHPYEFHLYYDS
jgi:glutamine synthetase